MNRLIEERRVGIFRISTDVLHMQSHEVLLRVFANFIIVRAETLFAERCIEYVAYSPLFGVVDEGEEFPEYEIRMFTATVQAVRR